MSRHHHYLHFHLSRKKRLSLFDNVVLAAAFLYPLSSIPQIIEVFQGNTGGVSLITWAGYTAFALLFFVYGSIHKIKPMIISNALWIIVDVLVVLGVLLNR